MSAPGHEIAAVAPARDLQLPAAEEQGRPVRSQFVRFAFFRVRPAWLELPPADRKRQGAEFIAFLNRHCQQLILGTYSLAGFRADVDFMLWLAGEELEDLHGFAVELSRTGLGRHLERPYSFLASTRRSVYVRNQREGRPGGHGLRLEPAGRRFLFVYPFVKTRAWYALPLEERQEMMNEHIRAGNRFPSVRLNTTYSFGLDDQEFVVAFETDEPRDFVELVMALRETRASAYTLRDTPIFTCMRATPEEIIDALGA